ncbi:hypothetical protein Y88_3238 [Novosphingobium nitrogenifigens DSM 19370]|uniref:Uncharacterized protein n=1 Tax=Novosphingobium nitrogenifigens DSM 19370 TaxID=983920 RepID=F1ZBK6_9SPHN|nr:hypothetical protein Y88_3238 [Novosphingobium nitrogenifigens DSM 19370]
MLRRPFFRFGRDDRVVSPLFSFTVIWNKQQIRPVPATGCP